jgi:hypothetical protein
MALLCIRSNPASQSDRSRCTPPVLATETPQRHRARRPAEEFGEGGEQVDRQEEQIAHDSHIITFSRSPISARLRDQGDAR